MNRSHQKGLAHQLKQQNVISQRWLNTSRLLGFVSGILVISQAQFMARTLQHVIIGNIPREALLLPFTLLFLTFVLRAWVVQLREQVGYHAGRHIHFAIRRQVLDHLRQTGPARVQGKPVGNWTTLVPEQVDDIRDYYARYLPQMALAVSVPLLIVVATFPSNWATALTLLDTAPLVPLFMALVGMGAADADRCNFLALAHLSGHFPDRLRGMETLRIFGHGEAEIESIRSTSEDFRQWTMEVLRLAFLSSGILKFFTSLSIALMAVYFGFSYLGELDFSCYDTDVTLAAGFLAPVLAPEFFRPLHGLGTFYHAKTQATDTADSLKMFAETPLTRPQRDKAELASTDPVTIEAEDLFVTSSEDKALAGPLNFTLPASQRAVSVGRSGSGKSSLLNALSGFLSYQGPLRIDGMELHDLSPES